MNSPETLTPYNGVLARKITFFGVSKHDMYSTEVGTFVVVFTSHPVSLLFTLILSSHLYTLVSQTVSFLQMSQLMSCVYLCSAHCMTGVPSLTSTKTRLKLCDIIKLCTGDGGSWRWRLILLPNKRKTYNYVVATRWSPISQKYTPLLRPRPQQTVKSK